MYKTHELELFSSIHLGMAVMNLKFIELIDEKRKDQNYIRNILYAKSKRRASYPYKGTRVPNSVTKRSATQVMWLIDLVNSHLIQKNGKLMLKGYDPARWGVAEVMMHIMFYFDYYNTPAKLEVPLNMRNFGQYNKKGESTVDWNNHQSMSDYEIMRQTLENVYISTYRKMRVESYEKDLNAAINYLKWYVEKHGSFEFPIFDIAKNDRYMI